MPSNGSLNEQDCSKTLHMNRCGSRCVLPVRRLLVMSATLGKDLGERLAALLADDEGNAAPLLVSAGRQFPVKTTYLGAPGLPGESCPPSNP